MTGRALVRAGAILEAAAAIVAGTALARLIAGPLRVDLFEATLSIRSVVRPLIAAAVLVIVRLVINTEPSRVLAALESFTRVTIGAVLSAGVVGWLSFLSRTCGGADSYGYVSAAERLLSGSVVQHEPLARLLPFADAISAATPLGYTPSTQIADASAPVYPLGLPALMAVALALGGHTGPFFVAPVMGVVLLGAVYAMALSLTHDRLIALIATAFTAVHPVVFTYAIQPMSDVPAAACFAIAVAALVRDPVRPLLAGIAAAVCLVIRPALAPALAILIAIPYFRRATFDRRVAAAFVIPFTVGVAVQLLTQWRLYGHPLANGYADMGTLFSIDRVWVNARSYSYWAWRALGPVFLGATALGLFAISRTARLLVFSVGVSVAAPYLVYRSFDHWETLRFLLPALVVLTIPGAAGVVTVSRLLTGLRGGFVAVSALTLVTASLWAAWLRDRTVFVMPEYETRYRIAGELVQRTTPPQAVILAALHSGSIRYYSGRQSLNFERIPVGALPASIAALRNNGHGVYLLLDGDEERALFEARHGSTATWLPGGQRRNVQLLEAPARD